MKKVLEESQKPVKGSNYRKPTTGTRFMEGRLGNKTASTSVGEKAKQNGQVRYKLDCLTLLLIDIWGVLIQVFMLIKGVSSQFSVVHYCSRKESPVGLKDNSQAKNFIFERARPFSVCKMALPLRKSWCLHRKPLTGPKAMVGTIVASV